MVKQQEIVNFWVLIIQTLMLLTFVLIGMGLLVLIKYLWLMVF